MDPPPLTRIFRAVGRTQGSHEPPNPGNKPGEIRPLTGNRALQAPISGIKNALGKAAIQSPWFSESISENKKDWSEKTYLNIFGSLPKNLGRPSKTSKWKYISFSKRYRLLRDHTYWFRLLSTRVRAKLLNLSTVELQSVLDFPDLVISSAWYSGAGYYFCDRIAKCLITVQLISNHFLTKMMVSLKEWRKRLRKSYFIGGPWIDPPQEWSLFTHHPLRGVFHLRETWVLQRVITLTETRSTGLATRDMCREKVADFISVTCGDFEDPPRRQISIGNLRGRPHRQPTISLSGSATFEFTRKMRGHFGHVVSILNKIGNSEVKLIDLDGVTSTLPPGSHLLDRRKKPDYLVWLGKELVPNLLTPHLGSIVFSKCLEEFRSRRREFISARILTVKERGKARILLCSESFYSQLQFPFSKLVNSALEDTPEYSTGLRGTDDSWAAFRDIPNLDEDTQCAFICSDLTEATDSPPFWVVEECIMAFHSKGWISTFYRDLLVELVNLPRRFEWPPNSGKFHITRRGSPMGDPITKSCITIVSGLCIREALSVSRYKYFYRVKGDDLLIAILGTVPNYDCVQVLERLIQYLLDHGLRPSDLDTFISGFAFYCEGAFIAPYWYNSFKIVQSRKIENVFIDPVKGRYLLPLFKKDSARPHSLGELPVAKIQQLNKQIAYYKAGSTGFARVNDMIRTQRVCFRSGHLRDFWYPFPASVGGLDGFLGLEPPTEWLKNQENWFYWTYLYLCVRSSLLTLREEIFPPEVKELFDTTFRRSSDFSYSGKHILRRIDLSEFGYTPIWNSYDERNYGTLLYPELTSYGEVSTEMSIISRLDSYRSMCTDGDNQYSNYFQSSLKAFEKKALPAFPYYRKSTVWNIYISKPKNLHSGSPWTLYYKEGPGNYLHSSLRVGTSTDVVVRPNIEQNLRFIEGVRKGEFKTSPTNADSDLEIAIQLRNCLMESKDQFVWAHINSRDFSMRTAILHFCKDFLKGRTLLLYFSSWWIQQELLRSKGTCDLTFREIYSQSYEDRATVLRCGKNYFSNFKFFVSVNGDDFVRPRMADFSETKFQFIEVFVDFTNVQYQMLDSGYTYATISGGIEIDNLEPCKRFHRLAGNTRQSLTQRHEFDDVDSVGSVHSLPLPPDEVRIVHSYDVLRRARAARMGLLSQPRPPDNRSDSTNWRSNG